MRLNRPVWEEKPSVWHVFRHEDVKRALSDYEHFSSQRGATDDPNNPISASLISSDPPRHRQLRALVSQAFTPRAINNLTPRIETIAAELIQDLPRRGLQIEVDIVDAFTAPLPVIVIAELLGVPASDRSRFKVWSDAIIAGSRQMEAGEELTFNEAQREMVEYFSAMIHARVKNPQDDLISGLVTAKVDGESLSQLDILGFCILLLVAGNETTTNLLSNALFTLHKQPELWAQLTQDPSLISPFIEEVLRFRSPVQHMYRTATADVELSGIAIPAGSHIVAWIGSANRDEAVYPDAQTFRIHRDARNIAFGHGIHFCLGAPLARLEAKIALHALLKAFDYMEIPSIAACEPVPTGLVYGFQSMPTRMTLRAEETV